MRLMDVPEIHYARSGDVSIAYQVVGSGSPDLVFVRGFTGDLLSTWEHPLLVRHVMGLAENGRVLMLDKRGTGLSDRVAGVPTLETRMDDVRAVLDAVGSDRAVLWSGQEGTRMTTLFAATYPERTAGLVILDPSAKGLATPDYPWAPTEAEWRVTLRQVRDGWGTRPFFEGLLRTMAPSHADDPEFRDWFVAHMRRSMSPGAATAFHRMMMDADVADILPVVRVPTLILCSPPFREPARYFAERIPRAEVVELTTMRGDFTWLQDDVHEAMMQAAREFVSGLRHREEPDRILATLLFTDIVGSTARAAELGDRRWSDLLTSHHTMARAELARFRGKEIDTAGDGFLAMFDGPARAVRCAQAIGTAVRRIGLEIRAGVHTGEVEPAGDAIRGLAIHIGARVAALADPGEVLVSSTVRDLVAGSGLVFEDRGEHELKGVPDRWHLYTVAGT
jgi:class 3 adenylate cyclase